MTAAWALFLGVGVVCNYAHCTQIFLLEGCRRALTMLYYDFNYKIKCVCQVLTNHRLQEVKKGVTLILHHGVTPHLVADKLIVSRYIEKWIYVPCVMGLSRWILL